MKILLSEYMYKHYLTARQVEIMTGIPKSTVARIASGQTIPRLDTLEQLARGLHIRISDLYISIHEAIFRPRQFDFK